ncbi:MAG: extracellular solute-binding protein [Chloroflexi bacterium]|nr:extracellular solute-binding protein [Chloroflexota bacterium]
MATRKLTVWASDGASLRQLNLGSLEIGEIRSHGWDWKIFHTDLLRSLEKGLAPDVIEVGTTWTNRLAREGSLLNITQFATEYLHAASIFFPHPLYSCLDAVQIDQYYALPLLADVRILFYNKDYLNTYLTDHPNAPAE